MSPSAPGWSTAPEWLAALAGSALALAALLLLLPLRLNLALDWQGLEVRGRLRVDTVFGLRLLSRPLPGHWLAGRGGLWSLLIPALARRLASDPSAIAGLLDRSLPVRIHHVRLELVIGTGDAATTAVLCGGLAGGLHALAGAASTLVAVREQPAIRIVPVYGRTAWSGRLGCILEARLGDAIRAGWRLYRR